MRTAMVDTLLDLAAEDPRLIVLTADLGFTVLERFAQAHPDRFLNVGVAEANMIGMATGLAMHGFIPYCYSIATFASMRGYEAIRNGPVHHRLPVRILGIGGGFAYGHAGATHHALEDFAILRVLPGMTVVAPADPAQTRTALRCLHDQAGPVYFRIGKGGDPELPGLRGRFRPGGVECLGGPSEILLLSTGGLAVEAAAAARSLEAAGVACTLGVAATLAPVEESELARLFAGLRWIFTLEEHYRTGGLGSLVADVLSATAGPARLHRFGVPADLDRASGSPACLRARAGLDAATVSHRILELLGRSPT